MNTCDDHGLLGKQTLLAKLQMSVRIVNNPDSLLYDLFDEYVRRREIHGLLKAEEWLQGIFGWLSKNHRESRVSTLQDPCQLINFSTKMREMINKRFPIDVLDKGEHKKRKRRMREEWRGTLQELAQLAVNEVARGKHRGERKTAAQEIAKAWTYKGEPVKWKTLYKYMSGKKVEESGKNSGLK